MAICFVCTGIYSVTIRSHNGCFVALVSAASVAEAGRKVSHEVAIAWGAAA